MYFFDSSETDTRKQNVLKAYHASITYINLMAEADRDHDYLLYAPTYPLRMYFMSCVILLKVLRSSYAADVDFELGRKLCNQAIIASSKSSIAQSDSPGKVAKLVSQVWHSSDVSMLQEPPKLMVKSRLGAR